VLLRVLLTGRETAVLVSTAQSMLLLTRLSMMSQEMNVHLVATVQYKVRHLYPALMVHISSYNNAHCCMPHLVYAI